MTTPGDDMANAPTNQMVTVSGDLLVALRIIVLFGAGDLRVTELLEALEALHEQMAGDLAAAAEPGDAI